MPIMATRLADLVPLGEGPADAALQHLPWRNRARLSSIGDGAEHFLATAGFDRGPWLVVAFAGGIALWLTLPRAEHWVAAIAGGLLLALGATALWRGRDDRAYLLLACVATGLLLSAGTSAIWARSEISGAQPIERPLSAKLNGRILQRIEQPAEGRVRLVLATRDPAGGAAIRVRVNLPIERDSPALVEGAVVRLKARLMPPAPPMLPGGLDFARTAWFAGLAATGSVQGEVRVIAPAAPGEAPLADLQRRLSAHVRSQIDGSPGAIAAAFASGDRGGIATADEAAMRDAGLTHLLSISGVHVSALIAAVYVLVLRLCAAWPWMALRVRLPLVAAGAGALAGVGYTLLTGAEVPTVRSCIGALLVMGALALGREPLSLRMLAVAAFAVLLVWPEALAGPSFQMSFAAVAAIIALHGSGPVRRFLAPREEGWWTRAGRNLLVLVLTGVVIEAVLTPVVLFHFHRAGLYGALANVVAIPLVSLATMPLIALALLLDAVGAGGPVWWLVGRSIDLLLAIAHATAGQPGAVRLMPQMGQGTFALFVAGGLWLGLWQGRVRLLGLLPVVLASGLLLATPVPDVLITGDGRQVAITRGDRLYLLRDIRSPFTRDTLMELAGVSAEPVALAQWPGARCSRDFCTVTLRRGQRDWHLLLARGRGQVEERALAAACERADVVVSDGWLPRSCRPRWLKADRRNLAETGGLAIGLDGPTISAVADSQGEQGWWRGAMPDRHRAPIGQ
jgi:competence protein ComEC